MGILVVGSLLKPRKPATETVAPLSQTETQRLLRLAQRQALDTMSEHFASVAAEVAPRVVPIASAAGGGVVWAQDLVVVPGRGGPAPAAAAVTAPSGDRLVATHFVSGPRLPLAAYRAVGLPGFPAPRVEPPLEPTAGEWVLVVWRQELDHAFAPGHYLESRLAPCGEQVVEQVLTSVPLTEDMAGGGLFDLDGSLVGVVLPCGGRPAAVGMGSVSRLVAEGRTLEGQLLARFGLALGPLDEPLRAHFGPLEGIVVLEVWAGYPGAAAGLRPGDIVESLDGRPVTALADLQPLVAGAAEGSAVLDVGRGRRRVEVTLAAGGVAGAEPRAEASGLVLESPAAGYAVADVVPGSRADEAGLRAGDRILRVDDAPPRSAAELRRVLDGRASAFLELERDGRRLGLLLR